MNQKAFHGLGPDHALTVSWTPRSAASLWEPEELSMRDLSLGLKIQNPYEDIENRHNSKEKKKAFFIIILGNF